MRISSNEHRPRVHCDSGASLQNNSTGSTYFKLSHARQCLLSSLSCGLVFDGDDFRLRGSQCWRMASDSRALRAAHWAKRHFLGHLTPKRVFAASHQWSLLLVVGTGLVLGTCSTNQLDGEFVIRYFWSGSRSRAERTRAHKPSSSFATTLQRPAAEEEEEVLKRLPRTSQLELPTRGCG